MFRSWVERWSPMSPSGSVWIRSLNPKARWGHRSSSTLLGLLGALMFLSGCVTQPERPRIVHTGDPIIDGNAELAAAPPQDRVLWDYRIAATALRAGNFAEARTKLDDAIS